MKRKKRALKPLPPPDTAYVKGRVAEALQPTRTEELRQGRDGAPWVFQVDTPKVEALPDGRYAVDADTLAALMGISADELLRRTGKYIHHGRRFLGGGQNKGTTLYRDILTKREQVSMVDEYTAEKAQNRAWTLRRHLERHIEEHGLTVTADDVDGLLDVLRQVKRKLTKGKRVV